MSDSKITRHLEQLAESCDEIMSSTRAVRGEAFANAVALNFEIFQIGELTGKLAGIAKAASPENAEVIKTIGEAVSDLMTSIICGHSANMSADEMNDCIEMAKMMFDRRKRTVDTINKDLEGGD